MFHLNYYLLKLPIFNLVLTMLVIWYLKYLWSRRDLYYYSRKVKGPFSLPIIGTLYKFISADGARFIEIIGTLADKYSGFCPIWIGQDLKFVITIPEYIDKILINSNALDKSKAYDNFQLVVGHGVFTAPTSVWKNTRKLISTFLSRKNLKDYMNTSVKFVEQTTAEIKDEIRNGKEVDVVAAMVSNALNVSFETTFGERPELLTSEYNTDIIERIMDGVFQRTYTLPYRYYFIFAMSKVGKSVINLLSSYRNIIDRLIQYRRKQVNQEEYIITTLEQKPNLMDYLLTAFKEIKDDAQTKLISDEIMTFIMASADTSSTASNFMLLVLGLFPEIQENIYKEVVEVYGKSEPIDWKKIHELNYLDRIFKETLRLFPIGPYVGRKIAADIELVAEKEIILPKGSSVYIPILHIHRSETYWPNPLKFDPDRFLPDNMTKRHRCTYLPFSHGPRNCVGMIYGQTGVKLIIANLVRAFFVTTDYKSLEEVELHAGLILRPKNGFKVHVDLRK